MIQQPPTSEKSLSGPPRVKNRNLYRLLAFFLGWLGIHNWYALHSKKALIQGISGIALSGALVATSLYPVLVVPSIGGGFFLLCWVFWDILFCSQDGQKNRMKGGRSGCWVILPLLLLGAYLSLLRFAQWQQKCQNSLRCLMLSKEWKLYWTLYVETHNNTFPCGNAETVFDLAEYPPPSGWPCPAGGDRHYLGSGYKTDSFNRPDLIPLCIETGIYSHKATIIFFDGHIERIQVPQHLPLQDQVRYIIELRSQQAGVSTPDWESEPFKGFLQQDFYSPPPLQKE